MSLAAPRRTLGAAVLALALAAAPVAGATPASADGRVPELRVLSYNAFLMSKLLYPNSGQDHRAAEIAKASFFHGNDVVVLQEAFDNSSSDALKSAASAEYPYQTPVVGRGRGGWDATGGAYSALTPEDGGVTVLSKWPILRKEQYVYKDACGADWWSNKGFAYVVLDVRGTRVHVVGTHAQSTDPGCGAGEAAKVRGRQFRGDRRLPGRQGHPGGRGGAGRRGHERRLTERRVRLDAGRGRAGRGRRTHRAPLLVRHGGELDRPGPLPGRSA
ncbi:hypothetical protein GCM10020256_71570 [Streptomyces thermocoprophilus]